MKKSEKQKKRLQRRQEDFKKCESKPGYHKPGSNKK